MDHAAKRRCLIRFFNPPQLIPLRVVPVPYDSVVTTNLAVPGYLVVARLERRTDGAPAGLRSAANSGAVFAGRRSAGRRLNQQREKACQLAGRARELCQFSGFIKIVCDVGYIRAACCRRRLRWQLQAGRASVSSTNLLVNLKGYFPRKD